MTDPTRARFFQVSVEVVHADKSVTLEGMAFERGITRIMPEAVPSFIRNSLGKAMNIKLDSLTLQGVFSQQYNSTDSFFEIQFIQLQEPQLEYLRQRVKADGTEPVWHRKYPRIPVVGLSDPDLPVPNLCMLHFAGEQIFASVVNFTLGGIRIEVMNDTLRDVKVGARLEFDLITTTGEIMSNLKGDIKNIAVREQYNEGVKSLIRSYGIRIVNMDADNGKKYRTLIKDYCVILKKKLQE